MKNEIIFSENKTLLLKNAIILDTSFSEGENAPNIAVIVSKMDSYIKSRGAVPVGPLIQKNQITVNEEGILEIKVFLIRQTNTFIRSVEKPYMTEPVIRIKNCLYSHFVGPEDKMKFAYDKINLYGFENDIKLSDESYSVFVGQQDDTITVDVFVEKKSDD